MDSRRLIGVSFAKFARGGTVTLCFNRHRFFHHYLVEGGTAKPGGLRARLYYFILNVVSRSVVSKLLYSIQNFCQHAENFVSSFFNLVEIS